jgi:pectate lyase
MRIQSSIIICVVCAFAPLLRATDYKESDRARMQCVEEFVNNALKDAADRYHTPATPLLANGVHLVTKEQLKWRFSDGTESVISSLSSQQNFFRVLVAMSALTGDARYEKVARDNIAYYFAHYQEPTGLLQWGSHRFIDLQTLKVAGPINKSLMHEMKSVLPFYELMYKVDAKATERLITGIWKQHVLLENGLMFLGWREGR